MKQSGFLLLILIAAICASCKHGQVKKSLPFGSVAGPRFIEVRRVFDNGLMFDRQGYQLEPAWNLYFLSDDSVLVLSPKTKKYYGFHVYFDHDSVFNMVDVWFKVKKITKDSLVFQALRVENKVILDNDEGSKVFLTFYSDPYRNSQASLNIPKLGIPGPRDTLYIKDRAALAARIMDSAFAAKSPVKLISKTALVTVEAVKHLPTPFEKADTANDYLAPEYNITIHKAYQAFDYSFYVFVDRQGKMYFRKSTVLYSPEYKITYEKIMKGIMDGYLAHYLKVIPGNTLGIAHTSSILLNVTGEVR